MTTALDIIKRGGRLAGWLGKGETPDDEEAADGLVALNSMLDSMQLERLFVYQIVQGAYTWPSATTSRTIGSGGNFAVARPNRIEAAFVTDSNSNTYPVDLVTMREEYDSIVIKTTPSTLPRCLFMDSAYPLATLYLWPVPSVQVTLSLNTWQTLQSFADLTTVLSLPPGYERMVTYNFALEYGPEFGAKVPDDVRAIANSSKSAIKNLNAPTLIAQVDSAVASLGSGAGRYNIYSDT